MQTHHPHIIAAGATSPTARGGLYVHWPFCETKCGYCDFFSIPLEGQNVDALLDALCRELRGRMADTRIAVETVFLGGGTPTTLDSGRLGRLARELRQVTRSHRVVEFTIEANPATVDEEKARLLVGAGVTRVSLGAQSFHEAELAALERLHRPEDVDTAVSTIRNGGITDFNLDLIFGISGQTLSSWGASLAQRALDLGPTHLSCYGLTYEAGTRLTRQLQQGRVVACAESLEADMYMAAVETLTARGFEHYEISNFARPGRACQHNLGYWQHMPSIGVGPSAVGFANGRRYKNACDIGAYVRGIEREGYAEQQVEEVTGASAAIEALMLGLRMVRGIDVEEFLVRTGVNLLDSCHDAIEPLRSLGLLRHVDHRLRLSAKGLLVADAVLIELAAALDARVARPLSVVHLGPATPAPPTHP